MFVVCLVSFFPWLCVAFHTTSVFISSKMKQICPSSHPKTNGTQSSALYSPHLPLPLRMVIRVELLVQGLTEIFLVFVCTKGIFKRISAGGDIIFPSVVEAGYISLFFTHAHTAFGMIHHRQYPCRRQQLEMPQVAEGKITLKSSGIFF